MQETKMDSSNETKQRKNDHIRINLEQDVASGLSVGFDRYTFIHKALPELDLKQINLGSSFLGRTLNAPLLISSMTGGTEAGTQINTRLAEAAQHTGIAMGVGSQRSEVQDSSEGDKSNIRKYAPDIPLYANLGAVQLNYGFGLDECKKAIDRIQGDALILHLNPLQEALQPEGQTNFAGLLNKIEAVCLNIGVPVIVKEVGWGISSEVAIKLINAGVSCIDVAGAGGTSWALVEKYRNREKNRIAISEHFHDWGIPTSDCLIELHSLFPEIPLIASGGIKKGIDIGKSIALGASIAGIAGVFFMEAAISTEAVVEKILEFTDELRITMFVVGAGNVATLATIPISKK
jgi:isopentenyl-diphosphate delta-isomerase